MAASLLRVTALAEGQAGRRIEAFTKDLSSYAGNCLSMAPQAFFHWCLLIGLIWT